MGFFVNFIERIKRIPGISSIPKALDYFKRNANNKGLPSGNHSQNNDTEKDFEDNIESAEEEKRALIAERNSGEKRFYIITKEERERIEKYRMRRYQIESTKLQRSERYKRLLEQGRKNSSNSENKTKQNDNTIVPKSEEKEDIVKRLQGKEYIINGVRYKSLETSFDDKKIIINEETVKASNQQKNGNDLLCYDSKKYERMKEAYNKTKRNKKIIDFKRKTENIDISKTEKSTKREVITKKQEREEMRKTLKYETDPQYKGLVDFEIALNKKNREKRADKDDREIG